ncbi:MAG TPA: hypothetical protein PKL35_06850 [Methanoregulaceae archaeon]|nr:hypothetical protein [Methanoregulaceae archaeon]
MRSSANQKQQSGEHSTGYKGLTVIIILCFLGIMPLLIWISLPENSTYAVVTTSSAMIQSAAAEAGLEICSQEAKSVEVQGAQSAILYQLAPDCSRSTDENRVKILVVGFNNTEDQMAAIAEAQVTYSNWQTTNTAAFMSGTSTIIVHAAPGNQAVGQISSSLIGQGAARIL